MPIILILLFLFTWPTPGPTASPIFSYTYQDKPQAFTVSDGQIYVLTPHHGIILHQGGQTKILELTDSRHCGALALDGRDLILTRNLLPLDEPREILRYSKSGELLERSKIPQDPNKKISITMGQELSFYPQTMDVKPAGNRYILLASDGRRWLMEPGQDTLTPFPRLSHRASPGELELWTSTGKFIINTKGTATDIRWLGVDGLGQDFWAFTDFLDHDNRRQIIARANNGQIAFVDVTNQTDARLLTWASLDKQKGQVYTANTQAGEYQLYRISNRSFRKQYPNWQPQTPSWFNLDTNDIIQRQAKSQQILDIEELNQDYNLNTRYNDITRQQVWDTALTYVNHEWTLDIHHNGSTPDNTVAGILPRWLTQGAHGQTIRGLPYCWGGSVTIETFHDHLSQGRQAGNIAGVGNWQRGTTGVDCSGFIWNCYGYPSRPGNGMTVITSPRHWTQVPNNQLVWMDMARKPGHVVLFITREPSNPDMFYTIEATAAMGNDRVMMWYRHFSSGYQALRYNHLHRELSKLPLCSHVELEIVHSETEEILLPGPGGSLSLVIRELDTFHCPVCDQQWLKQAN